MKSWFLRKQKGNYVEISKKLNINPTIAKILSARGFIKKEELEVFLNPQIEQMHDPHLMKDMDKGIDILLKCIKSKKKIKIISDYDVDGLMSNFILYTGFKRCGIDAGYYIPDRRKDGYGLNENEILEAHKEGYECIITCDNGTAAETAITKAKELGMTVIVTDHHDVSKDDDGNEIVPRADAIINPKQKDCLYPCKKLCGATVAFKFIQCLYEKFNIPEKELFEFMPFIAIATICDVMELVEENRIIVKYGLKEIHSTGNLGLNTLIEVLNLKDKELNVYDVGFILGPCMNSAGRLMNMNMAMDLLLEKDIVKAKEMAENMHMLNKERQDLTNTAVEECVKEVEEKYLDNKVLILFNATIDESIAGIVAGRIKDKYNKPTVVLTSSSQEYMSKGSGRSIEAYNMFEELSKFKGTYLEKFGGHPLAAGMSIKKENIKNFREKINKTASLTETDFLKKIKIDIAMPIANISYRLIDDLKILEPFGNGNPSPLLAQKNVQLKKVIEIGEHKEYLKFNFVNKGHIINGVSFNKNLNSEFKMTLGEKFGMLLSGLNTTMVDIIYVPNVNIYNGNISLQLIIKDIRV